MILGLAGQDSLRNVEHLGEVAASPESRETGTVAARGVYVAASGHVEAATRSRWHDDLQSSSRPPGTQRNGVIAVSTRSVVQFALPIRLPKCAEDDDDDDERTWRVRPHRAATRLARFTTFDADCHVTLTHGGQAP